MGKAKASPKPAKPDVPLRLEYLDPADLAANPLNYRTHPAAQTQALKDVIGEVGWAGALLYNERTNRLIDGHARKDLFGGAGKVPVLIGSWSEEQEAKILATLDPLAAMAEADKGKLDALLRQVQTESEAVGQLLTDIAAEAGALPKRLPTDPANDPNAEWQGMPEFQHEDQTSKYKVIVHIRSDEDLREFEELIGQTVPQNRWAVWYPEAEVERFSDKEYATGDGRGERP